MDSDGKPEGAVQAGASDERADRRWWIALCIASIFPLTALLHAGLFYPRQCMLNRFGDDYAPRTLAAWLARDPSLPLALVAALVAHRIGRHWEGFRRWAAPALAATLPITVWIWDIPFTGRGICRHFHDRRFALAPGIPLRTGHVLWLCLALYVVILGAVRWSQRRKAV